MKVLKKTFIGICIFICFLLLTIMCIVGIAEQLTHRIVEGILLGRVFKSLQLHYFTIDLNKVYGDFYALKSSISRYLLCMMLDDTRCCLDASSLHRTTSMDIYMVEKFHLLSCHRDTSSTAKNKA